MSVFTILAPKVIADLMRDFKLTDFQAAGILGNIGTECAGFTKYHEVGQPEGKGGYGWCQWTATRRTAFLSYCKTRKAEYTNDDANYGFLKMELAGTYKPVITALRSAKSLEAATEAFERKFEGAGVLNMDSRNNYAKQALTAYRKTVKK